MQRSGGGIIWPRAVSVSNRWQDDGNMSTVKIAVSDSESTWKYFEDKHEQATETRANVH